MVGDLSVTIKNKDTGEVYVDDSCLSVICVMSGIDIDLKEEHGLIGQTGKIVIPGSHREMFFNTVAGVQEVLGRISEKMYKEGEANDDAQ